VALALTTGLLIGEPRALAQEARRVHLTARADDPSRRDYENEFGPFYHRDDAVRKKRWLEHRGWRAYIEERDHHEWWVVARRGRR
jgi:hypothetical protein